MYTNEKLYHCVAFEPVEMRHKTVKYEAARLKPLFITLRGACALS